MFIGLTEELQLLVSLLSESENVGKQELKFIILLQVTENVHK